jgi:hypothetical protein
VNFGERFYTVEKLPPEQGGDLRFGSKNKTEYNHVCAFGTGFAEVFLRFFVD